MVRSRTSGEFILGMVVAVLAIVVPCRICLAGAGAHETRMSLSIPVENLMAGDRALAAVPIPQSGPPGVSFFSPDGPIQGELVQTAFIRDQRIALYELPDAEGISGNVRIEFSLGEDASPRCVDAGPMTAVCEHSLLGYDVEPASPPLLGSPLLGAATATRCYNLQDCEQAGADVLLICGTNIFSNPYVDSLAALWTDQMGLNVAIVDVGDISFYSPVEIHDFIKDLYYTSSADHYGDGHLGFVVLLGDAYENDNLTPMVPEYDGYGGTAQASDHYYACIVGTDDFEDVMIGRIPVGGQQQLANYYAKRAGYTPLPEEAWTRNVMLAAGCYLANQDDYVTYFDSLDTIIGDDFDVSRWYRYDYPATDIGDALACQAMVDSLSAGRLFMMYSGDGDKWDWGGRWERVFRSDLIDDIDNAGRLPIVLAISCLSGYFDNTFDTYTDGGVDCLAERLLNEPDDGAVAVLASSREAGGNASVVFAPEIMKAAFENGCSFLGELMMEAKTQHLLKLGQVVLVRQFNLFGDPCMNFILNQVPVDGPDLVIRPNTVDIGPEFPLPGESVQVTAEVWNAGGVRVNTCEVSLYSGHPDSGGVSLASQILTTLWGWEKRSVAFTVDDVTAGVLDAYVVVDGAGSVEELDEDNNIAMAATYIYPCEWGYPMKLGDDVEGHVVADLDGDDQMDILVTSGGTQAVALDFEGNTIWLKDDLGLSQMIPGIQPSAFDLNGDGTTEVILTNRGAVIVADGATGSTIWTRFTDYPSVPPIITDVDEDSSFDIVLATYTYPFSRIHVLDAAGNYIWYYDITNFMEEVTAMVACDADIDGTKEIIYSTSKGNLKCLSCSTTPPTTVWSLPLGSQEITSLVAGDLERDGVIKLVASMDSSLYVVDAAGGSLISTIPMPACISSMSLGNMDGDLELETVCVSDCGRIFEVDDGSIVLDAATGGSPVGAPALGDMNQDGSIEIIVTLAEGTIEVLQADGADLIPPIPMKASCVSGPTVGDIDGDGKIEILAGSSDSLLFILDLGMMAGRMEWMCQGATGNRTNLYAQPVYGEITGDVMLTDRIDVVGDVVVDSAGALTFQRGSDVRFVHDGVSPLGISPNFCELIVDGEFNSVGTKTEGINLRPFSLPCTKDEWMGIMLNESASATITGTDICGAVTAIEIYTSDTYIGESTIRGSSLAIKIAGASPTIDHNLVTGNSYGINSEDSSPIITGNLVTENYYSGVILSYSAMAVMEDNIVEKTVQGHGLACYSASPTIFGGNKFRSNSQCGIYLSNSSPVIDSCWVGWNGDCGIKAAYYSEPEISKTSLVANRIGLGAYVYAHPVLGDSALGIGGDNDIRQNTFYAVYNVTPNQILAHRTWWGEVPPDPSRFVGDVDYSGWLTISPAGIDGRDTGRGLVTAVYPNPFFSRVNIKLSISEGQVPVSVDVFDITGRLVRKLDEFGAPGEFRAAWDGSDSGGNPVASGIYFFAVTSRSETLTRKVILVR